MPQPEVTARSGSERHSHEFSECFISHNNPFSWGWRETLIQRRNYQYLVGGVGGNLAGTTNMAPIPLHPWQIFLPEPKRSRAEAIGQPQKRQCALGEHTEHVLCE